MFVFHKTRAIRHLGSSQSCRLVNLQMASKKKKRSCPFSSSKPRKKEKGKKAFSVEAAADLASSDKGSFYNQEEWLQEIDKRDTSGQPSVEMSANRSKIRARFVQMLEFSQTLTDEINA